MTTTTRPRTATKPEITAPAIFHCTNLETLERFYAVPSDSVPGKMYTVAWNERTMNWQCDCPARKPCKHERAVREVVNAREAAKKAERESAAGQTARANREMFFDPRFQ